MLKKTIPFIDYNGVERTEDCYFNLTQAEVVEMEMGVEGGYSEMINRVIASKNAIEIMRIFKDFISKSYGIKSPDGIRFEKSAEISNAFMQTEAYSNLFMELCTDANSAAEFVKGILPKPVNKQADIHPINAETHN